MDLSNLKPPAGSRRPRNRVGRGIGSGNGKTCGRGMKGTGARSGTNQRWNFEGGQMPIQRRLPKRGFTNIFRVEFAVVNLKDLAGFEAGATVDFDALTERGLVSRSAKGVKILGEGDVSVALTVNVDKISASARAKLEAAGGTVTLNES